MQELPGAGDAELAQQGAGAGRSMRRSRQSMRAQGGEVARSMSDLPGHQRLSCSRLHTSRDGMRPFSMASPCCLCARTSALLQQFCIEHDLRVRMSVFLSVTCDQQEVDMMQAKSDSGRYLQSNPCRLQHPVLVDKPLQAIRTAPHTCKLTTGGDGTGTAHMIELLGVSTEIMMIP